ncbi:MAG TPA: PilZ domain-containing protein [Qipengyuania sp.]|nr:PilZ domain-containing protein [Qipengyuania sp.]
MLDSIVMPSVETRNFERDSLFLMAELVLDGGVAAGRVTVRNLSAGGMMIEGAPRLVRGTRVALDLRNIGPVLGTIAWTQGRRTGVAFDDEIDPKQVRTQVFSGEKEAPVYARAALDAPRHDGWNGKLRRL